MDRIATISKLHSVFQPLTNDKLVTGFDRHLIQILTASTELPEHESHGVDVSLFQGSLAIEQIKGTLKKFRSKISDSAGVGESAGLGAELRSVSKDGRSADSDGGPEICDAASQVRPNENVSAIEIPEKGVLI